MEDSFQSEFLSELLLQGRNLAGAFRGELSKHANTQPIVQEALQKLERDSFEGLINSGESGVAAMEVPGYPRAIRLFTRRFSREVSDSTKQHSILLDLCRHVYLRDGMSSSTYSGGVLSGPSPLSHISHQVELPVAEFSDPEGMMIRRIQASARIEKLTNQAESIATPGNKLRLLQDIVSHLLHS